MIIIDFSTISSFISSVGFPIAVCIYLFHINEKSNEQHSEQIKAISQSLDNNTKAIQELTLKIGS